MAPGPRFDQGAGFSGIVFQVAAVPDSSGGIYVAGNFDDYDGTPVNHLVRLHANGRLDADLGSPFNSVVTSIAPATDGSGDVYAGGLFDAPGNLLRMNADGTVDAGFTIRCVGAVYAIVPEPDGSGDIHVAGEIGSCGPELVGRIARLGADGTVNTGFEIGSGFNDIVNALARAADGDLYVGGGFTSYDGTAANRIVRLDPDGQRDAAFDIGLGFNDVVLAIALATDGSGDVYVGGGFTSYNGTNARGIVRLNADGTPDTGFDLGSGFDNLVMTLVVAGDGSGDVYVGGGFTLYKGVEANHLLRLQADGSRDAGFATGAGFDDSVRSIALAADGSRDVYVGGQFRSYNTRPVGYIARLREDGTLD